MASLNIALHMMLRLIGNKRGFIINMLVPTLVVTVVAGLVNNNHSEQVKLSVVNADAGSLGSYVVEELQKTNIYLIDQIDITEQQLKEMVNSKDTHAALYIPEQFTEEIRNGSLSEPVLYRLDEQLWNAALALQLEAAVSKLNQTAELALAGSEGDDSMERLEALMQHQNDPQVRTKAITSNVGTIVSNPLVVGLVLMFILLLVGQSIGIVMEDRELRTMARIYTTPVRAIHISFGYFLGSILMGTTQLSIMLLTSYYVFDLTFGLTFGELFIVLECFLFAAVGLSTALAGMMKESQKLSQINNIIIIPTCMIGGCFWPISMMPEFMQKLSNIAPQKWAIEALDKLGAGAALSDVALQLTILLLFAAVLISFGATILRPNQTS